MNQIMRIWPKVICGIFTFVGYAVCGFGQLPTVTAVMETPPTGPNSQFTVSLQMSSNTEVVSGMAILVGYEAAQGTFLFAEDNTGQPGVSPIYSYGEDMMYDGTVYVAPSYADLYVPLLMDTENDLVSPTHLARLVFETSASYNIPNNKFHVHIAPWSISGPEYGGLTGSMESGFEEIPVEFVSLEPSDTSVEDWNLY